jgi:hypothetical protein
MIKYFVLSSVKLLVQRYEVPIMSSQKENYHHLKFIGLDQDKVGKHDHVRFPALVSDSAPRPEPCHFPTSNASPIVIDHPNYTFAVFTGFNFYSAPHVWSPWSG